MSAQDGVSRLVRVAWPLWALWAPLIAIAVYTSVWGTLVLQRTVLLMFVLVVLVVGLYIFTGNSGIISFGHMSFMSIGAYVSALLTIPPSLKHALFPNLPGFLAWVGNVDLPFLPAIIAASLFAAVFAAIVAIPIARLSGVQAGIATLAVLVIVYVVVLNWNDVTRGASSMIGVPTDTTLIAALIGALLTILAAYAYQESTHGMRLRATREDEQAARAVGISIPLERGIAWVISAFFVAVGGVLYGHFITTFSADQFYFGETFITVAMLVIGGMFSLTGAVIGVIVVTVLSEFLRNLEMGVGPIPPLPGGTSELILSVILLVILILRPQGIVGGNEAVRLLDRLAPRRRLTGPPGRAASEPSPSKVLK